MNTVINYASKKLSKPRRGYSYVHDSKLLKPCHLATTMLKMLSVTTGIVYGRLCLIVTGTPQDIPSHPLQTDTKWISNHTLKSICCIKLQTDHYLHW